MKKILRFLLLLGGLLGGAGSAWAHDPATPSTPSLATALNSDGTLRPGVQGSFDARQFRMQTDRAGRPVFRPVGTTGYGDEGWQPGFTLPNGVSDAVNAVAVSGTTLYVAGEFTAAGALGASHVARWNGTAWSILGTSEANGVNGRVYALALAPNGDLYAAGSFSQAGTVGATNVARWNGTAWSPLGAGLTYSNGNYSWVAALAVTPNGDVYAAGGFSRAGTVAAANVARWNGTAWNALDAGLTGSSTTYAPVGYALAVASNGDVYAGGNFTQAGAVAAANVARWNGTTWSSLGAGLGPSTSTGNTAAVAVLAVAPGGDLYAAGSFAQAGGGAANGIARWNGTAWSSLGPGLSRSYFSYSPLGAALTFAPNGDLYVGGNFTQAGNTSARGVARWNGSTWSGLGGGAIYGNVQLSALALAFTSAGALYVGGNFTTAAGASANNVARWSSNTWSALGSGQGNGLAGLPDYYSSLVAVRSLVVAPNGNMYAGGSFQRAGSVAANNVARWNGTAWSPLGLGIDGYIFAMAVAPNGDLYVGGNFTLAGGLRADNIARWNGTDWTTLGPLLSLSSVYALAVAPNGDVYAGGGFAQINGVTVNGLGRWNGSTWSAVGGGFLQANGGSGQLSALAFAPNGDLYAGGSFTQAGSVSTKGIARWNGTTWSALGAGLNGSSSGNGTGVGRLALAPNGDVYVGGDFSLAGGAPATNLARWNGTAWSPLGAGLTGTIAALTVVANGDLYVGGSFTYVSGLLARNVARWDGGSWNTLGTGVNSYASALLGTPSGKVYVGGYFSAVGDGSQALAGLGLYNPDYTLAAATATPAARASVFPNPARGAAVLRLPAGTPARPLVLLDARGRVVRRYPAPTGPETTLDVQGLPAGLYLVQCGALTQRLLVEE